VLAPSGCSGRGATRTASTTGDRVDRPSHTSARASPNPGCHPTAVKTVKVHAGPTPLADREGSHGSDRRFDLGKPSHRIATDWVTAGSLNQDTRFVKGLVLPPAVEDWPLHSGRSEYGLPGGMHDLDDSRCSGMRLNVQSGHDKDVPRRALALRPSHAGGASPPGLCTRPWFVAR